MDRFTYIVNLNNFTKDLKGLDKTLAKVEIAIEDAFVRIGDLVYKRLLENISYYGLGDTSLASTATITRYWDGFAVSVGADYAFFVEYGTGVVGQSSPHPSYVGKWEYDTNGHGIDGWYYPTTESDPNPYKHYYNGVLYGFTRGMPSRPFMYNTWLYGTRIVNPVVHGYIRRALK